MPSEGWSANGGAFTTLPGVNTATSSTTYEQKTVDFSGQASLNNAASVRLRYTLSGATNQGANVRIDDFTISGTLTPTIVLSLGLGLFFAALNVEYRDFRYLVPFIVQFGLYISPVGFQSGVVPERYRFIFALNPMVGIIDGFRWSISGGTTPFPSQSVELSLVTIVFFLVTGIWYFRKTERTFADII